MVKTISVVVDEAKSDKLAESSTKKNLIHSIAGNKVVVALAIFAVAVSCRLWHNNSLEHRVWYLEDAQNYLRSGNAILRTVKGSTSPAGLLADIEADARTYSGIYHAFDSDKLVDRLLTDGPMFPLYLSAVEAACGLDPKTPQYENITSRVSIANSALDALTCVGVFLLGSLLLGNAAGIVAGLAYALYPPAIVNTQWCMSETFCTFMLVASTYYIGKTLITPRATLPGRLLQTTWAGIIFGATILSRPAFPLLLPILAVSILVGWRRTPGESIKNVLLKVAPSLVSFIIAFSVTVSPWLLYTKCALGQARLTTNRLPAFNLISGNLSSIDGWTPFPNKLAFPEDMKAATTMIVEEAKTKPVDFALLQMKKVARLWSAVWNDCKYSVFGLGPLTQNVWHQLLLFMALGWGLIACSRARQNLERKQLLATSLVAGIVGLHFVYLSFIALARYAFTAVPFVILAASAAAVWWWQKNGMVRMKYIWTLLAFSAIAAVGCELKSFAANFAAFAPGPIMPLVPWLCVALATIGLAAVWYFSTRAVLEAQDDQPEPNRGNLSFWTLALSGFAITICGITGSITGSRAWAEWSCPITHQTASQTISIPAVHPPFQTTGYILCDLSSESPLPQINVSINGTELTSDAIPLAMLQKDNESIVRSLAIQAGCMDTDYRSTRHWFAVPFPTNLIADGKNNTIELRNRDTNNPVSLYGDISNQSQGQADGATTLPSINSMSWNYAVEGCDFRQPMEPRPFEQIQVLGKTIASKLHDQDAMHRDSKDLSPSPGKQTGRYRIRVLLKNRTKAKQQTAASPATQNQSRSATEIFKQSPGEHTANGGNPVTFYLADKPVAVPEELLRSHPIRFTCDLKAEKHSANANLNIVFKTGIGDVWTPSWQPECIPLENKWKHITIIDSFPKLLLEHNGVNVQPIVTPFNGDLLFSNQKKAARQKVVIKNAKLEILDTPIIERQDLFKWDVY
ncbi:MAG: hypothetical protein K2X93_12780 [Candidatus Obscuribacterales bacterium]|nr:hypothetical protein [Candidatus Obscuribacterales bacterium]